MRQGLSSRRCLKCKEALFYSPRACNRELAWNISCQEGFSLRRGGEEVEIRVQAVPLLAYVGHHLAVVPHCAVALAHVGKAQSAILGLLGRSFCTWTDLLNCCCGPCERKYNCGCIRS